MLGTRIEKVTAGHLALGWFEIVAAVVVIGERLRHASRSEAEANSASQDSLREVQASTTQPAMRNEPPIGVIAPNQRGAPKAMA